MLRGGVGGQFPRKQNRSHVFLSAKHYIKLYKQQKCGLPLAEEQKNWKTFFSHTARSLGSSVHGVFRSHGISELPSPTDCCMVGLAWLPVVCEKLVHASACVCRDIEHAGSLESKKEA